MKLRWPFSTENPQQKYLEIWERTEKLEREMKSLRLEWENTYDKLNQMAARTARRAEKMHLLAESDGKLAPNDDHAALTAQEMLSLDRLGPAQRRIQMQILMRRKAANGGA